MPSETPSIEQLRTQLTALGIALDDERLARLLPAYSGVQSGAHRLAMLDLGATEPAMIYGLEHSPRQPEDRR